MYRFAKYLIFTAICLTLMLTYSFAQSGGTGTEENPYLIANPEDLHWMAQADSGSYFKFTADIDMAGDSSWVPLVSPGKNQFFGHIDGDYHVIKNLVIIGTSPNTAFIADMGNPSSVKRLGFINLTVRGVNRTAGLCATVFQPGRVIEECFIENGDIAGDNHVGGFTGWTWPNGNYVRNCYFDGIVQGADIVGGLFSRSRLDTSYAPHEITNCIFYGRVSGLGFSVGPISGDLTTNSTAIWDNTLYYNNVNKPQAHEVNATAVDSNALNVQANYPTLDFDNIWTMGEKYPVLKGFVEATAIKEAPSTNLPNRFTLKQNYPNPFNPKTVISFTLSKSEHVVLEVFNV
ncbi:MAG: hypothetical protein J7L94_01500, partial [Caldisericaceae bacterium]|nr:hypothetical protein [Caldisericaceae bacterium]